MKTLHIISISLIIIGITFMAKFGVYGVYGVYGAAVFFIGLTLFNFVSINNVNTEVEKHLARLHDIKIANKHYEIDLPTIEE